MEDPSKCANLSLLNRQTVMCKAAIFLPIGASMFHKTVHNRPLP